MSATEIAAGTTRRRALRAGAFALSDISFAPGRRLPWHEHPNACVAVVVEGAVRKRFARTGAELGHGGVVAMPPVEPHEDDFGREGARLVVVEAGDGVDAVSCFRDWGATLLALRIARELDEPDAFTPLALEGLALELTAAAARGPAVRRAEPWLERARELLHERCLAPPSATELASAVGVHPSHLARAFRARFGDSPGGYARRLRLEWAAERLVRSDTPLVRLAAEAGFVDQSHFTRAFRRLYGLTPARYRAAHR
jgi:AraC family transcriptional regulator